MVKSGEVFPANFPDKGPEQPLRLARLFTGLQPVRMTQQPTTIMFTREYNILEFFFFFISIGLGCIRL